MLIIEGWIRFAAGEVERLGDVGRTMIAETHKEPGCLDYAFSQDMGRSLPHADQRAVGR